MKVGGEIIHQRERWREISFYRTRAFTLLEIMVAMALFVMVIAAVYSSWMLIIRGSTVGKRATAAAQRSRVAVRTIEESLAGVRSFAADIQYYSFVAENGNDATLSFVARLPEEFPRSGRFGDFEVRRVTFSLEPGANNTKELVLRQAPLLVDMQHTPMGEDEEEHPVVLAKEVQEFKIEFRDQRSSDWLDEWAQTNQLPKLVKITLETGPKDYAGNSQKQLVRIIALPSVTVQPNWQSPLRGSVPGGQATNIKLTQ